MDPRRAGDDDGGDGGIIFPGHPGPIPNAPRDNISRKGIPSLRRVRGYPHSDQLHTQETRKRRHKRFVSNVADNVVRERLHGARMDGWRRMDREE